VLAPVVLGMDFGGTKIAVAVADASGVRLGSAIIDVAQFGPAQTAGQTFQRGVEAAHRLLAEVAAGRPLAAVGACTFGIPHDDHIDLAPTIAGWGEIAFGRELRGHFSPAQVRVATDVKAAAQAEADWGSLADCNPGLYVNLGTGLAAAIVVDGTVLAGSHGAAGEIGYNRRGRLPRPDHAPAADGAGVPASLEEAVSGKALNRAAVRLLGPTAGAADLFASATTNASAAAVIDEFLAELAFHVVNLVIAVDPERVSVGGGMVRSWDHLVGPLRKALRAAVPFPPALVRAEFPFDSPLVGALALASRAAHDAVPAGHSA
jgi:glucokinase